MNFKEKLLLLVSLVLAVAGAVIQAVLLGFYYESDMKLYVSSPLVGILTAVSCVAVLLAGVQLFIADGRTEARQARRGALSCITSCVTGGFAIVLFVLGLMNGVTSQSASTSEHVASLGALICTVFVAAYFIFGALFDGRAHAVHAMLGIGSMAWCVFKVLSIYFDMSYPLTSGVRIYHILTLLSMLLFITAQTRYSVGEGKRKYYLSSAMLYIFFGSTFSIPSLICLFDISSAADNILFLVESVGVIYAVSRIITLLDIPVEEKKMEYVFKSYDYLTDVDWNKVERAKIDKWGWGYDEYKPECYAQGVYTKDRGLVVLMTAMEKEPRAVYTEFMSSVCCDSCMEFFFSPDRVSYANFEFNAIGTMHASCGAPGARGSVDKFTEMPVVKAEIKDDRWQVMLVLSHKNFKDITGLELGKGTEFYGNFYKCGDECEIVHYGMWNEVKTEKPSFHQPDYFGNMYIE